MSSMHLSSHRLRERINQNSCIIKLIINEYPNNLSFDLLGFDPTVCLSLTQETALQMYSLSTLQQDHTPQLQD